MRSISIPERISMTRTKPLVIGITGGVGAGKSSVLKAFSDKCDCVTIFADDEAKKMQEPGQRCYNDIVTLFGEEILNEDKSIDKVKMAELIYKDENLRQKVNAIIHPAVNEYIKQTIDEERRKGEKGFVFIEAALLIECGYDRICDELWYVYAAEDTRRQRLKNTRGYSDEKIDGIFASQLPEKIFREKCAEVIDNDGDVENLPKETERILKKKESIFAEG